MKARENDYRASTLKILALHWLRDRHPDALLIPEFCAAKYGDAMIDVAAITPNELIGIEIKGDGDSTARLERQGWVYSRAATRMYLLPAPSLRTKAVVHRPRGWSLIDIENHNLSCKYHVPGRLPNAPAALLNILCKAELLRAGKASGVSCHKGSLVHDIANVIAERASLSEIRTAVLAELLNRDWAKMPPAGKTVYRPGDSLPKLPDNTTEEQR